MKATDALRLAAGGLRERKTRTVLTLLGIVIGSGMIVALVSVTQGASASISEELDSLGPTTVFVAAQGDKTFTAAEVQQVARTKGVDSAYPAVAGLARVSRVGLTTDVLVLGIDPAALAVIMPGVEMAEGSWISSNDVTSINIGASVAEPRTGNGRTLADVRDVVQVKTSVPNDDPVGPPSVESTRQYRVAGIAGEFGSSPFFDIDNMVVMSPRAAADLLEIDGYNRILVRAESPATVGSVQETLEARYTRAGIPEAMVLSGTAIAGAVQGVFTVIGAILGGIAAISLVVAGVGIANTMLVSVLERVTEIGTMKALGFRSREVLGVFLLEAGLTGLLGGIIGAALGVGMSFLILGVLNAIASGGSAAATGGPSLSLHISPVFSPEVIGFVLLFAVGVSVLAGLLPSRKAARLDPVVALKRL